MVRKVNRLLATVMFGLSFLLVAGTNAAADGVVNGMLAYERGDFATAVKEWLPAAEQGERLAQVNLGVMYYNGEGVTRDYKEAAKWFKLAAKQGSDTAQVNLGFMYSDGIGVRQDYREAVKWFREAVWYSASAQNNLGFMYEKGRGVLQDNILAHMWYNIAASNGSKEGIRNRDKIARKMTSKEISKAQELARDCAAKGNKGC